MQRQRRGVALELALYLQQGGLGGTELQFVGLGHEDMDGHVGLGGPFEHQQVEILERMADVHHQYQPHQHLAFGQIVVQVFLPLVALALGHLGVAVAGQVHQAPFVVQGKKVDQLRAAGGF